MAVLGLAVIVFGFYALVRMPAGNMPRDTAPVDSGLAMNVRDETAAAPSGKTHEDENTTGETDAEPSDVSDDPAKTLPRIITGKDGVEMIYVPDGVFFMGSDDGETYEGPRMRVFLEGFYIDRVEISNERFAAFVTETGYKPSGKFHFVDGDGEKPARNLTWSDVNAYCGWAGKRLPGEYEWEKAARGGDDRTYPWGKDGVDLAISDKTMSDVNEDPQGQSPFGCLNMSDNVWEWTNDWFDKYVLNPGADPRYGRTYKVLRGGMTVTGEGAVQTPVTRRMFLEPDKSSPSTGGRCARDP